ncbi:MAG: hypothetical protein MJ168_04380 [Clostridia bacterium]|nr:hypothetical protein [Clostridia bacterium]
MKTKKKGIIAAAFLIVIASVLLSVFSSPIFNGIENLRASEYTSSDIKNVDKTALIAHCAEVDGKTNSVSGFKEAVRLGADGVVVDLCFCEDGTPVMTDSYAEVKSSPLLEDLFKAMSEEKYSNTKLYLNIVQLSDLTKLNKLASEYDIAAKTTIIGIDADHYGLVTSDDSMIPFYLDYKLSASELSDISKGEFSVPDILDKYGASGLVIDYSQCSQDTVEAFDDYGIPVIISSIDNNRQLSKALLDNAQYVWVSDVQKARSFLNDWIHEMQSRFESSVEQSLKDLSTTKSE